MYSYLFFIQKINFEISSEKSYIWNGDFLFSAEGVTPPISGERGETRVKMNRMRQRIAERLKDAQNTNAMLTTFNEIDLKCVLI